METINSKVKIINNGFAISKYHDIKPIYEKLNRLVSLPLQHIEPAKMEEYLDFYNTKCPKSKETHKNASRFIPGGSTQPSL